MDNETIQLATITASGIAILISLANFIHIRTTDRRENNIKKRDDDLLVTSHLNNAFEYLWGKDGYSRTRNTNLIESAEIELEYALKIEPNNLRAIEYEGHIYEIQGNIDEAKKRYEKSILINPVRGRPYNCLGLISEGEHAISHFKKAIELDVRNAYRYNNNLGKIYVRLGELDKAEECFNTAISLNGKFSHAYYQLGCLHKKKGEFERARKYFENAISVDANHVEAMTSLGALFMENLNNEEEGIAWLEYSISLNSNDDYPVAMLAAIYADRKQPEKSLEYVERAMCINPTRRFQGDSFTDLRKEMNALLSELNSKENS